MAEFLNITPIHKMDDIWVKREDFAYWTSSKYPSGSKVRQYLAMAGMTEWINGFYPDGEEPPCIVGCSANSCQQIYVAATAALLKTKSIIYVPARSQKTSATLYCERLGAEINEVRPGYLSVVRKKARQRVINLGNHVVEWNRKLAILDTAKQCENIPDGVKRIIVPTGSGLTAAGVLIGTTDRNILVVAVATSPMTGAASIIGLARRFGPENQTLGGLEFIPQKIPYDKHVLGTLPDGTPLDPFYAAKAWDFCQPGDLFWPPGLRPVSSMPDDCQIAFEDWKGPDGI